MSSIPKETQRTWWVDLLDDNDNTLRRIEYGKEDSCTIDSSIHTSIQHTGQITISSKTRINDINWAKDRMRIWIRTEENEDQPTSAPVTFKFGTWNMYYSGAADHPWSGRRAGMASTVIESGVSVLAVQESDYPGTSTEQAGQLRDSLNSSPGSSGQWVSVTYGSRCGILYDASVMQPTGNGGALSSPWAERLLVWVLLRNISTGERVIVAADHWHPDNGTIRNQQATNARDSLRSLSNTYRCSAVLGVDMNDWSTTYGQPPAIMTAGDLFQRLKNASGATRTEWPTWHDWKANPPWNSPGQELNQWLDDIFVTNGSLIGGGIYDTTLPLTSALFSDHHLLTTTVQMTTADEWESGISKNRVPNPMPLGTFLTAAPKEEFTATGVSWKVTLFDKLTVLEQDCVDRTTSIKSTQNVVQYVRDMILSTGETALSVTESSKTLRDDRSWVAGTSKLRIINDLLDAIDYFGVTCDELGRYVIKPYAQPKDRPVVWEFIEGPTSHHSAEWSREQAIFEVPNKVILSTTGSDTQESLVSVKTNTDHNSPYSYQNRGNRWVTLVRQNVDAADQSTLDSLAVRQLREASTPTTTVNMSHQAYGLKLHDRVRLKSQGYDNTLTIYTQKINLDTGAMIQTSLREVQ